MALMHDWAETRVGDIPRTAIAYFSEEARKRADAAAFADIVRGTGAAASLYEQLHTEYEQRKTLEARLVKAADIIDLLVQVLALERAGARALDEFWEVLEVGEFHLDGIAKEIVDEVFDALLDARSRIFVKTNV
jgi:5'-deoxynucleotidase YfbR-like HD superfamily hydrolase